MLWYAAARYLEARNRYWGLLLGVAVPPHYEDHTDLRTSTWSTVAPIVIGWAVAATVLVVFDVGAAVIALQVLIAGLVIGRTPQPTY